MPTYFVYIQNPRYPEKIDEILTGLKAKKYSEVSWLFDSEVPIRNLFKDLGLCVKKKGFIFMIDVSHPREEMYWPTEDRNKFLRPHADLDTTVAQFLANLEDD